MLDAERKAGHVGDRGADSIGPFARSIIIPAHNESERIGPTLDQYLSYFGHDTEIIVVCNGCEDDTAELSCSFMEQHPHLRVIDEPGVSGKGGAVTLGFQRARGDVIAYVDADGATSAQELHRLTNQMDGLDGVVGSRWQDREMVLVEQPLLRKIASRTFNLLVRLLFGLPYTDTQCGAKAFRREAVSSVTDDMETKNFAFDVELLYLLHKNGLRIAEIPTVWKDQPGTKIQILRAAPVMLWAVLRLRVKHLVRRQ